MDRLNEKIMETMDDRRRAICGGDTIAELLHNMPDYDWLIENEPDAEKKEILKILKEEHLEETGLLKNASQAQLDRYENHVINVGDNEFILREYQEKVRLRNGAHKN